MAGLAAKEAKATLGWVKSLKWVACLTRAPLETEEVGAEQQLILCGDDLSAWGWSRTAAGGTSSLLSPISGKEAGTLIQKML